MFFVLDIGLTRLSSYHSVNSLAFQYVRIERFLWMFLCFKFLVRRSLDCVFRLMSQLVKSFEFTLLQNLFSSFSIPLNFSLNDFELLLAWF